MITGIHWPESKDKNWEIIYHFLRTGVKNPPHSEGVVQPIITNNSELTGSDVPLELEVTIHLGDTRTPSVASIQDIWVGADWNEKETWDLVGIDFEGHEGMRRVLNLMKLRRDITHYKNNINLGIIIFKKCMMMLRVSKENQSILRELNEEIIWQKCGFQWGRNIL